MAEERKTGTLLDSSDEDDSGEEQPQAMNDDFANNIIKQSAAP